MRTLLPGTAFLTVILFGGGASLSGADEDPPVLFVRGDVNGDGWADITDVINMLSFQ